MILEKLPRSVILCSLSIAAVLIAVVWVTFVTIAFAIMYLYTHVCGDACVFVYLRMCEEREKGEGVLRFRSVKIARSCPKSQNRQALIGLIERCNYFFFLSSFLLQTLTTGRKAGEGRYHLLSLSTTFSRFYHFHHSNT